jgi:hypothetical protein
MRTNDEDNDTNQHRLAPTESFPDERRGDSANEAANLIDSDDQRNHIRSSVCLRVDTERPSESGRVDETSHETIVVSNEQEAKAGQCRNRGEERIAFEVQLGEHVVSNCCHCLCKWSRVVDIFKNVSPYEAFIEVYHSMGEPYRKAQTARYMTAFDPEACLAVPIKLVQ